MTFQIVGQLDEELQVSLLNSLRALTIDINHLNLDIFVDKRPLRKKNRKSMGILLEPPSVMPELYSRRNLKKYDLVVFMSPWRAREYDHEHWVFQPITEPTVLTSTRTRNMTVALINDHKFGATKTSLYGLRRFLLSRAIRNEIPIELFGPNWRMSRRLEFRKRIAALKRALSNLPQLDFRECFSDLFATYDAIYNGSPSQKLLCLSNFSYSLAIENDRYSLTEKVFDCLAAGTIPLYVGPNLSEFTELADYVIQLPIERNQLVSSINAVLSGSLKPKLVINGQEDLTILMKPFRSRTIGEKLALLIQGKFA